LRRLSKFSVGLPTVLISFVIWGVCSVPEVDDGEPMYEENDSEEESDGNEEAEEGPEEEKIPEINKAGPGRIISKQKAANCFLKADPVRKRPKRKTAH